MPGVRIGRHARVRRAIIDRDVLIPRGALIGYDAEEDRRRHTVTESGIVVVTTDDEPFIGPLSEDALKFEAEADRRGGGVTSPQGVSKITKVLAREILTPWQPDGRADVTLDGGAPGARGAVRRVHRWRGGHSSCATATCRATAARVCERPSPT